MKEVKVASVLEVFDDLNELSNDVQQLMEKAIEARKQAYAPYSNFQVGAALLMENNEIVIGSNQENASYPSGLCAERTAIYYAGARFPKIRILKMAISAGSKMKLSEKPIPPCGACRQAIAEYEIKQQFPIEIYFMGETGKVAKSASLKNLLPFLFDNSVL
ncbi:cytidine deaminase [Gaetbulibacter aestuarii]|uniref:Cytidine deaminase n=1 Tax=Gaetbulibacter aestuarii TaxID=1502358 RepID=A0ABW7MWH0_9FLAO